MADLFAGVPDSDHAAAVARYSRLFGTEPSFVPKHTDAVWEVGEHGYLYVEVRSGHAGHARHTLFVDNLTAQLDAIVGRGLEPDEDETYENDACKVTFRDPDGHQVGLAGDIWPRTPVRGPNRTTGRGI